MPEPLFAVHFSVTEVREISFKDNVTCFFTVELSQRAWEGRVSRYSGREPVLCLEWLENLLSGKAMPGKLNLQSLQHFSL